MAKRAAVGVAVVANLVSQPGHPGTSVVGQRHAANGIVFPDLSGPYYAAVLLGYVEAASQAGRSVLVQATEGLPDVAAVVRELAGRVGGLVLLGRTASDEVVESILATGLPVVLVARPPVRDADCLRVQNRSGAVALGEHLAAHRFRSVRFIGSPGASPDAAERWEGVRDALAGHGSRLGVIECAFDEQHGYRAVRGAGSRPVTAVGQDGGVDSEELTGGNVTVGLVRIGRTVRRPAGTGGARGPSDSCGTRDPCGDPPATSHPQVTCSARWVA